MKKCPFSYYYIVSARIMDTSMSCVTVFLLQNSMERLS